METPINVPKLDTIIPIIVSIAAPDQIILFGSYARGDNREKSDIDLLILKKGLKRGGDIIDAIYHSFFDHIQPTVVSVTVYTARLPVSAPLSVSTAATVHSAARYGSLFLSRFSGSALLF